jgi:phage tail tube protein FII
MRCIPLPKFTHTVDVHRVMQRMQGDMKICVGAYKGVLETSFIMTERDFATFIEGSEYVLNQESVLLVEDGHRGNTYASLHYLSRGVRDGEHVDLGLLKSVDKSVALMQDAWTYRPDLNIYWITEDI